MILTPKIMLPQYGQDIADLELYKEEKGVILLFRLSK